MRTRRPRLSRRTAAHMLDHPTAHAHDGGVGEALSAVVSMPAVLGGDGEDRALAAFRAVAHLDPVPTTRGTSFMTRITRKAAAAPAAALAAAGIVLAGGGIAVAASQGAVHVPFSGHDNRPSRAPSATATVNPGISGTHQAQEPRDDATDTSPSSPSASPSATPSPSLEGLCVAYQAGAMDKAATNPAFTALQNAAGGADGVAAYCVNLIGEPTHPARPTHPAKPTEAATPSHRVAPPTHPVGPTDAPVLPGTPSPSSH
jgi:hypothetical protein